MGRGHSVGKTQGPMFDFQNPSTEEVEAGAPPWGSLASQSNLVAEFRARE